VIQEKHQHLQQQQQKKETMMRIGRKRSTNGLIEKKNHELLQWAIAKAREEFEQEKQEILDSVPKSYKDHFNEIVLVKWGKATFLPGLILNPYDVPPEPVRSDWLKMLKNVSLSNILSAVG